MNAKLIVTIGASAGGVGSLARLLRELPKDTNAAYFITLHIGAGPSILPAILEKASGLAACHPLEETQIKAGHIYVAPPNLHLYVGPKTVRSVFGPRENLQRPAVNLMFRSAAQAHGKKVVGVVLTGMLDDGAKGLLEIKHRGGLTMVQAPEDSPYPDMPRNAIIAANPHICVPLEEIRELLLRIVVPGGAKVISQVRRSTCRTETKPKTSSRPMKKKNTSHLAKTLKAQGAPSGLVCPDCHGPLWELGKRNGKEFRCLIGHTYSPASLDAAQNNELERVLWIALRALEERADLQWRLAQLSNETGSILTGKAFKKRAEEYENDARAIRKLLNEPADDAVGQE